MQAKVPPPDESKVQPSVNTPTVLQSKDLLGTRQIVDIEHNGQRYRLQTTKAGKLILTK
jgi:hemin uptake protein HemP